MAKTAGPPKRRGPITRFPNKRRMPFALQLPPHLHVALQRNADRLGIRRGDVICELLERYGDTLDLSDTR